MITRLDLDIEAEAIATDIFADLNRDDSLDQYDLLHEYCDSHEYVIYYQQAREVCANCDTRDGEEWIEEIGGFHSDNSAPLSFTEICSQLAYATLYTAARDKLEDLLENKQ